MPLGKSLHTLQGELIYIAVLLQRQRQRPSVEQSDFQVGHMLQYKDLLNGCWLVASIYNGSGLTCSHRARTCSEVLRYWRTLNSRNTFMPMKKRGLMWEKEIVKQRACIGQCWEQSVDAGVKRRTSHNAAKMLALLSVLRFSLRAFFLLPRRY